ncbi:MAG: protein-L-isoaspartate O-methyltransferase [Xanthomonadales bacterium]|nr:protein-L-isoaspartate O-methyltransferase [Xanthomonadales bacterium]MCB1640626.1 protein-L-isoaspartate O-methyltransferase [Xanthomonadales bacterium]
MANVLNFERARFNMVEQQVRPWDVLDARVLEVIGSIKREDFVPVRYRKLAYADLAIPIGEGQVMMKPVVEGRVLQSLTLDEDDEVLEIGTGSGYLTACLSRLVRRVTSIDIREGLLESARNRLQQGGYRNVQLELGDATTDFEPAQRFDAIAVTGAVARIPEHFRDWLAPGGRLFVVHGSGPAMSACRITRQSEERFVEENLFETMLDYLDGAQPTPRFDL